jgi:hypothetical protein
MTADETNCFKLLDGYSRSRHACFVAEMFVNAAGTDYTLCFRPTELTKDSPNRYACRYLNIRTDEITTAGKMQALPASITELLDRELPVLPKS